jgi:hypothetical protein
VVHGSHRCTIWGVEPGVTDLFVAADGRGTNSHRFRKTSTKEYYDLCKFNFSKVKREEFRRQASLRTVEILQNIESLKTSNFDTLRNAIRFRMDNLSYITHYYDLDRRFSKLKMSTYQGKQKGLDEIRRRLTYGPTNTLCLQNQDMPTCNHQPPGGQEVGLQFPTFAQRVDGGKLSIT